MTGAYGAEFKRRYINFGDAKASESSFEELQKGYADANRKYPGLDPKVTDRIARAAGAKEVDKGDFASTYFEAGIDEVNAVTAGLGFS
jgi:hypothetical protein